MAVVTTEMNSWCRVKVRGPILTTDTFSALSSALKNMQLVIMVRSSSDTQHDRRWTREKLDLVGRDMMETHR